MSSTDETIEAARSALRFWDIEADSIEVIWRSENLVCRAISNGGERHVVRLHRPGYNTLTELRSEVAWVESLADFGITVARPVAGTDGGHHVEVALGGVPHQASLVEWVEGEPVTYALEAGEHDIVGWYRELGAIAATIRAHSQDWEPPPWFRRRHWDLDGLLGESPLWGRFWESPSVTPDQEPVLRQVRHVLSEDMEAIGCDRSQYGLIHADLHVGNVMVDRGRLTVIDFDDSGYGYFAHELAVALHSLLHTDYFEGGRAALVEGFLSVAPESEEVIVLIDTFLTIRSLMLVSWLDQRPAIPEYEHRAIVAAQAAAAAERYLSNG